MQKNLSYHTCQHRCGSSYAVGVDFSSGWYLTGMVPPWCHASKNWLFIQISVLRCWPFLRGKLGSLVYFRTGFWGKLMIIPPAVPPVPPSPPSCPYWKVVIRAMRTCNLLNILQMNVVSNFLKIHRNYNLPVTYTAGNRWVWKSWCGNDSGTVAIPRR